MRENCMFTRNDLFLPLLLVFLLLVSATFSYSSEPIPVVATLPVLKDFAEGVGGPHVRVSSLISGFESEHTYTPKPSDLILVKKATLLLKIGLGLETWVNPLIENADRPDLKIITTSKGVALIDSPDSDVHADHHTAGDPHIWLDPENAKIMIHHILDGLIQVDPVHEADYRERVTAYLKKLDRLKKELQAKVSQLKNKDIITHHPAWPYFAKRFGFIIKGNILSQIGSKPSAKKIGVLIRQIQKEGITVIVSEPQLNSKIPEILAEETGVSLVPLSPLPGAIQGTEHYLDLIRYNVGALVNALEKQN